MKLLNRRKSKKSMFKFDLQLFGGIVGGLFGGGGDSQTTSSQYTPSAEEKKLMKYAVENAEKAQPAIGTLLGSLQSNVGNGNGYAFNAGAIDYNSMNKEAQQQIAAGQALLGQSANGKLSEALQENMSNSIKDGLTNSMGSLISGLGSRGVINSSVTNKALRDMNNSAATALAQNYMNALNAQANMANSQISSAATGINTANMAQNAAYTPYANLYNLASGLHSTFISNPIGSMHNGTTSQTSTQNTSLGSQLGNAAMMYMMMGM